MSTGQQQVRIDRIQLLAVARALRSTATDGNRLSTNRRSRKCQVFRTERRLVAVKKEQVAN